jgi:aryl carrier-like protein
LFYEPRDVAHMTVDRKRDPNHESALDAVLSSAREALDVDSVDEQDDFLALGGSSLEAVTLCYALEKRGYTIDLAAVFESSSFAELAESVKRSTEAVGRETVGSEGENLRLSGDERDGAR